MDLADLNPGLLLALDALLRDANVTRAAARLGISQPALSARVSRLRELYGDTLFVPASGGRGVVPTPFAASLQPVLGDALTQLRRRVNHGDALDPASSRRTFTVAAYENPAAILAPTLAARVTAAAPAVRLAFMINGPDIAARLEHGDADLLLAGGRDHEELVCRKLLDSEYATAQRRGHPRGTGSFDLDTFCALDHVLISADGGGFAGVVDRALAPLVVAGSDCICTMPRRILERFATDLDVFVPPLALPGAALFAFWHPRSQTDQGHVWLREQLYAAARAPPGP